MLSDFSGRELRFFPAFHFKPVADPETAMSLPRPGARSSSNERRIIRVTPPTSDGISFTPRNGHRQRGWPSAGSGLIAGFERAISCHFNWCRMHCALPPPTLLKTLVDSAPHSTKKYATKRPCGLPNCICYWRWLHSLETPSNIVPASARKICGRRHSWSAAILSCLASAPSQGGVGEREASCRPSP